jgi:hypothetical protein
MTETISTALAEALRVLANWRWNCAAECVTDTRHARWADRAEQCAQYVESLPASDPRLRTIAAAAEWHGPGNPLTLGQEAAWFASSCNLTPDAFLSELVEVATLEALDEFARDLAGVDERH